MKLSYTAASFHFSAFALGVIVSGLLMNRVVKWLGVRPLMWVGIYGLACGTLLLVLGRHPAVTVIGAFVMGLLGVMISALFSSALAEQHGEFRAVALTESTMIASLVAALAPVAISVFSRTPLTWRAALCLMLAAAPVLWLVFGKDRIEAEPSSPGVPPAQPSTKAPLPLAYWRFWLLVLLVEAEEFCVTFWASDYLEKVSGFSKANAALGVSLFLVSLVVGRWLVSRLLSTSKELRLMITSLITSMIGFLLFWLAPAGTLLGRILALVGLSLTGLGVAGQFPMANSLALASAADRMVEASGRISLAMGLSILLMPMALARLADWFGIRPAYGVELALMACAILITVRSQVQPRLFPFQPIRPVETHTR